MDRRWNKNSLPGVLSDKSDPPANFLNQLNSHRVPCPSSFNGNWEEKMSAGKIIIIIIVNSNN